MRVVVGALLLQGIDSVPGIVINEGWLAVLWPERAEIGKEWGGGDCTPDSPREP